MFERIAARKRDIKIRLLPETWIADSYCYDSIEFIPLILLDNALKYSVPDSDVEIKMEQGFHSVKVIIRSLGPIVADENVDKIFEKFFRDESAITFSKEGLGMGLWIGQQILLAHNSRINYFKNVSEGRKIGLNIFTFDISTI